MSDDNPYGVPPEDYPPYPPKRVDGGGVALGFIAGIVLVVVDFTLPGVVGLVLDVVVVVGAISLMRQGQPAFQRGLGIGLLVAIALAILLVGTCLAILAGSDFG